MWILILFIPRVFLIAVTDSFAVVMNGVYNKYVAWWLWAGVLMIFLQVVIGGITRLTGSGLSITEWNVIMGTVPPMSEAHWNELFDKYKQFPQYKTMNPDMDLAGFKTIFFWEYFHRLWARVMLGLVFVIPFVYFLARRWLNTRLTVNLVGLFVFGGLQGLVGWLMVQSGLVDKPWVNPLKLSLHLMLAVVLFVWLVKLATTYAVDRSGFNVTPRMKTWLNVLIILLLVQFFFGGLMAGHKAALFFPTWPKIGDAWVPPYMLKETPWWINFLENKATIHFIHRNLAYVLTALILGWWWLESKRKGGALFNNLMAVLPIVVLLQVTLGILTVLNALGKIPIVYGALHQGVGLLLLTVLLLLRFGADGRFNWKPYGPQLARQEEVKGV